MSTHHLGCPDCRETGTTPAGVICICPAGARLLAPELDGTDDDPWERADWEIDAAESRIAEGWDDDDGPRSKK